MNLALKKKLKRWWKWLAGGAVALLLLAWLLFTPIVQAIIQHEIGVQVAGLLNATLTIDHLSYRAPLTVVISQAHLTATGRDGASVPVAELGGLEVSLARLPLGGPVIVDHLTLTDPVIYLTRLADGTIQIQPDLLRPQPPPTGPAVNLSQMIQVRKLSLNNLTVKVTDLTQAGHPTVQWASFNADAELGGSPSEYEFHARLVDRPLTELNLDGSVDVDRDSANLKNLTASGDLTPDSMGQLPPAVQAMLVQNGLASATAGLTVADGATLGFDASSDRWKVQSLNGELKFDGKFADRSAGATVQFNLAGGGPAQAPTGLDYLGKLDPDSAATISIDHFAARSGDEAIGLEQGTAKLEGGKVKLDDAEIEIAGGKVSINHADLALAGQRDFDGDVAYSGIELKQVKHLLHLNDPRGRMSGSVSGKVAVSGELSESGPIIVDDLALTGPAIDLTTVADSASEIQPNPASPEAASSGESVSVSRMIQFRKVSVSDLNVKMTDLTQAGHPTVQWAILDADAQSGGAPSEYQFHARLANKPLAELNIDGSVDVDKYSVSLKDLSASGDLSADSIGQLPPAVQQMLTQNGLVGATADLTIADGAKLDFDAAKSHWQVASLKGELKFNDQCGDQSAGAGVQFAINAGGPVQGAMGLDYLGKLDPDTAATFTIDPNSPLAVAAPGLPAPISEGGGTIQYSNGTLTFDHFSAHCGDQAIDLQQGTGNLDDGKFNFDNGVIAIAGGTIWINHADLGLNEPHDFNGDVAFSDIDLKQVKELLHLYDPKGRLSGLASGKVTASGELGPSGPTNLVASGSLHAENGDFFDLPGLTEVADKVNPDFASAGRVGNAAMVFTFDHQTLDLSKLAVSCPVIGIQGTGRIGADPPHTLHLNLVVAPLTGLKSQFDQTPVWFLGRAIGAVQNAITNVSQKLYSFEVTGTAVSPTLRAVPVPTLTSETKNLFNNMIKPGAVNLLDLIQHKNDDQQSGEQNTSSQPSTQ